MVVLAMIGLFFIVLSGIINAIQLKRFFRELHVLNSCTVSLWDRIIWLPRFVTNCVPKLVCLIPDILLMGLGGMVGLGGGVLGFIIGIGGTCAVTIIIKIAMNMAKKKGVMRQSYDTARQALRGEV